MHFQIAYNPFLQLITGLCLCPLKMQLLWLEEEVAEFGQTAVAVDPVSITSEQISALGTSIAYTVHELCRRTS